MPVTVFYASVSGNMQTKKKQSRIQLVLDSLGIEYTLVDITTDTETKDLMRKMAGNDTALPPQICNGDVYCGDYVAFENAVEMEQLNQFLKVPE